MPDPLSPVGLLVRALMLGGILAATGAVAFRYVILVPLTRRGDDAASVAHAIGARASRIGMAGAALVLATAVVRLFMQLNEIRDPVDHSGPGIGVVLTATTWGKAWIAQVLLGAVALVAFARRAWTVAALAALALCFTPAFSGHAIGSARLPALAVAADGLHMLGAACWIGAMMVLAAVLLMPRQLGHGDLGMALVAAFSPLALGGAATVAFTGAIGGVLHVGTLHALVESRYGRTLLIKVGMVLAVIMLGAFNWKRAGPKAIAESDERPMLTSIRAELVIGVLVMLATAALVVTPPPGEE